MFASDLRRAVDTVELAFAGSGVPVRLDARLRECDHGDLTGCRSGGLRPSALDVVARMRSFLRDLSGGRWQERHLT